MPHRISQTVRAVAAALATARFCAPSDLLADEQVEKAVGGGPAIDYMSSGYLVELVLGLVFVLICIIALAWFARRFRYLQSSAAGSMQVLGGISMGARERVVLLQVGSVRLLLGVAPGRINTLHVLDRVQQAGGTGSPGPSPETAQENFAGSLDSALSRGGRDR